MRKGSCTGRKGVWATAKNKIRQSLEEIKWKALPDPKALERRKAEIAREKLKIQVRCPCFKCPGSEELIAEHGECCDHLDVHDWQPSCDLPYCKAADKGRGEAQMCKKTKNKGGKNVEVN